MTSQAPNHLVARIGRNIAEARAEKGWSQRELGIQLGMDSRGVSRWETGKHAPSRDNLGALARIFDRDLGWFYADHDQVAA